MCRSLERASRRPSPTLSGGEGGFLTYRDIAGLPSADDAVRLLDARFSAAENGGTSREKFLIKG
jgi:hypothetical protein